MENDDYGTWTSTFVEGILVVLTIIAFSSLLR